MSNWLTMQDHPSASVLNADDPVGLDPPLASCPTLLPVRAACIWHRVVGGGHLAPAVTNSHGDQ